MKRILVIDAHPGSESFCSALASAYSAGAAATGAEVERIDLRDLEFDPILHEGYKQEQAWERDLQLAWEAIEQAAHICIVYPTWWGGHPALMQGFIERVFWPGKVINYHEDGSWDRLLTGRTADLITTMDTPPWYYRWINRNCGLRRVKQTIMEFTGVKTRTHAFGSVLKSEPSTREQWLQAAESIGAAAARE
jgi:putative NADPH-quinone reductase